MLISTFASLFFSLSAESYVYVTYTYRLEASAQGNMFYQAPTRHWENDNYVYCEHQFCTICTQAVYPFPYFWRVREVLILWRKGKTKRFCICLRFQTSRAVCAVHRLFQCWSSLFLELGFQSVFVVSPFFIFHCSLDQRTINIFAHIVQMQRTYR